MNYSSTRFQTPLYPTHPLPSGGRRVYPDNPAQPTSLSLFSTLYLTLSPITLLCCRPQQATKTHTLSLDPQCVGLEPNAR